MLEYLLLIAIAILIIPVSILLFVVWRQNPNSHLTISKLIAKKKSTSIIFAIIFLAYGICLSVFLFAWFAPNFNLGIVFYVLYTIVCICALLIAIFPDGPQKSYKNQIHEIATRVDMIAIPLLFIYVFAKNFASINLLNWILFIMFFCLGILFMIVFFKKKWQKLTFAIESLICVWCLVTLVGLSYFN